MIDTVRPTRSVEEILDAIDVARNLTPRSRLPHKDTPPTAKDHIYFGRKAPIDDWPMGVSGK